MILFYLRMERRRGRGNFEEKAGGRGGEGGKEKGEFNPWGYEGGGSI